MWLDCLIFCDCRINYHTGKANVVANATSWKPTGYSAHLLDPARIQLGTRDNERHDMDFLQMVVNSPLIEQIK